MAQLGRDAVKLQVPMQVDLKFGPTWGDAKHTWQGLQVGPGPKVTADPIVFEAVPLAAAESEPADETVTTASIPFMITRAMREQLHALGVSEQEIVEMTPRQAHAQLELVGVQVSGATPTPPWVPLTPDNEPEEQPAQPSNGSTPWTNGGRNGHGYPCEENETDHKIAEFVYRDLKGNPYLKVAKYRTKAGKKSFPQYHWENGRWETGKPKGPAIPYQLPELLAAPAETKVWICEGEKDAETLAALG